jgi:IS30 family transposase
MGKQYRHLTEADRIQIGVLEAEGYGAAEIAKRLNKNKSTIYRELGRNFKPPAYCGSKAHAVATLRRGRKPILEVNLPLQKRVVNLLKRHYSPRQVEAYLKNNNEEFISHETIYQFVYSDYGKSLDLPKWLARKRKKRKVRAKSKNKKSPIPNRNPINNRPIVINDRVEFGHWEGDLMIFSNTNTNLITLRERVSRVMIAIKNPSKHADVTAKNIKPTNVACRMLFFLKIPLRSSR